MARTDIVRLRPGLSGETIKTRAAFERAATWMPANSWSDTGFYCLRSAFLQKRSAFFVQSAQDVVVGVCKLLHSLLGQLRSD